MTTQPKSIFCHLNEQGNLCLGDSIIHLPFLRALRIFAPDAEITVFPNCGGVQLLQPIFGKYISRAVDALPNASEGNRYDWVFDLVGEKVSTALHLRQVARRRFYSTAARGWLQLPFLPRYHGKHIVRRHLMLLKQATGFTPKIFWPWPLPDKYQQRADQLLPEGPRYVGIAPGAGNAERKKRWPIDFYVTLAHDLARQGFTPVLFLGPEEFGWEEHFVKIPGVRFPESENRSKGDVVRGPALVIALAGRLSVGVTNCCGSGHMFALGGAPLVSIFGPTSYEKFAPFSRRSVCVLPQGKGNRRIEDVQIDDVMEACLWAAGSNESLAQLTGRPCVRVSFPEIDMNRAALSP